MTLLGTGNRKLVEASPMDRIWGIGFSAKDATDNQKEQKKTYAKAANTKRKQQWNASSVIPRKPINAFGENQRRTSSTSVSIALSSSSTNRIFANLESRLESIQKLTAHIITNDFHTPGKALVAKLNITFTLRAT
ncbi:unnamed protein product [Didymodactylos carnosus]|uniref:NADAR domain-containing protein n=1 Tax=Didymodactylos carnosus TaxID=1234261 RepID=A0A814WBW8_9BILA|nr:unnamed protein product [Didymodactylos carnosus]CAF3963909.1 unnamed protein product [Didymodactylos carnosus]